MGNPKKEDAQRYFSFDEIAALTHDQPEEIVGEADADADVEEDQIRALIDSIVDDPNNIMQFRDEPGIMERIFVGVLSQASEDIKTFFRIARISRNQALLQRLVDWSTKMGQADHLAFLLLRSSADRTDQSQLADALAKLIKQVKPETAIHILRASNPAKGSRLRHVLDVDRVWHRVISAYLENNDLVRAYLAMLWAGCGFRVDEYDPAYCELSFFKREFISHIKDWHANNDLHWRVFGRASKTAFAHFIPLVWQAHVDAGELLPEVLVGVEGFPVKILIKSGDSVTTHTRIRKLPYSGLVARFIKGGVQTDFLARVPFLRRARVANARLTLIGAMLQQLIIHHAPKEVGMVRAPSNLSPTARKPYAVLTTFDLLQRL